MILNLPTIVRTEKRNIISESVYCINHLVILQYFLDVSSEDWSAYTSSVLGYHGIRQSGKFTSTELNWTVTKLFSEFRIMWNMAFVVVVVVEANQFDWSQVWFSTKAMRVLSELIQSRVPLDSLPRNKQLNIKPPTTKSLMHSLTLCSISPSGLIFLFDQSSVSFFGQINILFTFQQYDASAE